MVQNDPFTSLAEEVSAGFGRANQPGRYLVDTLPWLQFVPEWFPGAGWKKTAKEWKQVCTRVRNTGYEWTLEQIVRNLEGGDLAFIFLISCQKQNKAIPSFISEHLQHLDPDDAEGVEVLKRVATSFYGAGSDTIVSANSSFFLLMSLHPEVQRKAQEEIDRVVGHDRLPRAQDKKDLPFVDAIMKEVMRLNPVTPLGEP